MVGGVGIVYKQDSETGAAGPEDPMLEARVGVLEADMKDVKSSLARLELGFARIEEKLNFTATKDDLTRVESRQSQDLARVESRLREDLAELRGRVSNLPTTWQIIGILAALLVGIASLVFATDTFMSRARAPAAVERSPG